MLTPKKFLLTLLILAPFMCVLPDFFRGMAAFYFVTENSVTLHCIFNTTLLTKITAYKQ